MNFDFTDDQKALKDTARRFLADVCPLAAARGVLDGNDTGFDVAVWRSIAAQGWCGAAIPEAYGGLGLGHVELAGLAEELGRALAPTPFGSSVFQFAEALLLAGTEAQKLALLPQVADGSLIGTLAVTEAAGPLVADQIATNFIDGRLSGVKLPVADGMAADRAVVLARGDDGPVLCLVDLHGTGVTRAAISTIDPSRGSARIVFADAPAEPMGGAGGAPGQGLAELGRIADRAAVMIAFEQLGGADRCLEMARDYALERYAFGRPIGGFQAIKHKLADVYVRNAVARANAYYGAWALSTDAAELPIAAAGARVAACAAYWLAARENIQTHGGIGFTWDADCHLFYRRARHLGLVLGSARDWKRRLADRLEAREAAQAPERTMA